MEKKKSQTRRDYSMLTEWQQKLLDVLQQGTQVLYHATAYQAQIVAVGRAIQCMDKPLLSR